MPFGDIGSQPFVYAAYPPFPWTSWRGEHAEKPIDTLVAIHDEQVWLCKARRNLYTFKSLAKFCT
jgi:hypothetical protein